LSKGHEVVDVNPPLTLWGREFDGFRRAVAAHAAAWPAGGLDDVRATWLGLPELEAAVLGPEPPDADLLVVPADWLPALAAGGRIRALTPYLEQAPPEGWPSAWSPSFHEGVSWGSDVYGLPFHDGPQLLFTRPSLLAERGLEPPATWSVLLTQAAALQEPGVRAGTVLAGAPDGHNNVYDLVLHLRRFGGDLVDSGGKVALDTGPVRAALAFLREVVTTLVSPAAARMDSNESGEEFAAGRVGVTVNWAGYAALAAAGEVAEDFACALAPAHDDGRPTVTVNAFWVTCISASCADPDRAWGYLCHATSAAMDVETTRAGASGARRSTWADVDLLVAHPEHALFERAHAHSRPLPRVPELPALVGVLNELVDAVVWRGEPMEPALTTAAATTLVPLPRSLTPPSRSRS
jgi:multiple sugar transport system substrate-binding protein